MYSHHHKVHFYETDLMGIVHHSNYLKYFEEARVAWAQEVGIINYSQPETAFALAVLETQVKHLKPCFLGDDLRIDVEAKHEGIRIFFQYRIFSLTKKHFVSVGSTSHVTLDKKLRPLRLAAQSIKILEKEKWTETWL